MFPSFASNNTINDSISNAVFSGELGYCTFPWNIPCSDFKHLLSSKDGTIPFLSTRHATFTYSVLAVFFIRAKKEMIGTDTRGIIAMVTDNKAVRDWTIGEFVGYAVYKAASMIIAYQSIAAHCLGTFPSPTSIRTRIIDAAPKAIFEGVMSRANSHVLTPLVSALCCVLPERQGHARSAWIATPSLGNMSSIPFFARQ